MLSGKKSQDYGFKNLVETQLTVSNVLRLVREDILWVYYSGSCSLNRLISAPYRKDKNPSFALRADYRGRVMFKDFGTGAYGDIFDYIQMVYGGSLFDAVKRINSDFKLGLESVDIVSSKPYIKTNNFKPHEKITKVLREKSARLIQIIPTTFEQSDLDYWSSYGITERTLSFYKVHCVKKVFLDRVKIYERSNSKDPCFAYYFPKSDHLKCYFPCRTGPSRFVSNVNNFEDIQGYYQCDVKNYSKKFLILTKSMKDCMCLHEMGYEAMAIHGEGHYFNDDFIGHIKKYYPFIASVYDMDKTGVKGSRFLWREYGIVPFFLPRRLRSRECKDVSDLYKKYGSEVLREFIAYVEDITEKVTKKTIKKI